MSGVTINAALNNVRIINGTIRGWPGKGLQAGNQTTQVTLEDLRFRGCGSSGINSAGSCVVRRCDVNACGGAAGINVSGSSLVEDSVVSNTTGNSGHGIAATFECRIINCSALNNPGNGIQVSGDCIVLNCTATGNIIGVAESGGVSLISKCTAYSNHTGISGGFDSIIEDCSVNTQFDGCIVAGSNTIVRGNLCVGNGKGGGVIGITVGANGHVENNHVTNCGTGVSGTGSGVVTTHNVLASCGTPILVVLGDFTGTQATSESAMNTATNSFANVVTP